MGKDPWGNEYQYVYPGTHGGEFDLFSLGADNQPGGEGTDAGHRKLGCRCEAAS